MSFASPKCRQPPTEGGETTLHAENDFQKQFPHACNWKKLNSNVLQLSLTVLECLELTPIPLTTLTAGNDLLAPHKGKSKQVLGLPKQDLRLQRKSMQGKSRQVYATQI